MSNRTELRELNAQEIEAVAGGNPIAAFVVLNMFTNFLNGEDGDILKLVKKKAAEQKAAK
jgi:hypothetical protein